MKEAKNGQNSEQLLSTREVADILGLSPRTVHRLNSTGKIIKPLRISGSVRYARTELMSWIKAEMPDRKTWKMMKEARCDNG